MKQSIKIYHVNQGQICTRERASIFPRALLVYTKLGQSHVLANHATAAGRGSKLSDDNGRSVDIAQYLAILGRLHVTWRRRQRQLQLNVPR